MPVRRAAIGVLEAGNADVDSAAVAEGVAKVAGVALVPPKPARRLGVSPNTIRNYVANGQLTAIRVGPKLLKFDVVELDRIAQGIDNR
jgi:hypothetical protein